MKKFSEITRYTDKWGNQRVGITQAWVDVNAHKAVRSHVHRDILDKAQKLGYVSAKMFELIEK